MDNEKMGIKWENMGNEVYYELSNQKIYSYIVCHFYFTHFIANKLLLLQENKL